MREDGIFKRIDRGFYCSKRKGIFFLRQKRRNKKEKFFLTFQTNFFEKTLKLPSCSIDSVRIIGWEEIKAGDYVLINFGTKKNNVITVAKLVTK